MTLFSWWSEEDAPSDVLGDNRDQQRTDAFIELTLCCSSEELAGCHTVNISIKGALIELPHEHAFATASTVTLRFHIWTGRDHIARYLRASVVRQDERGLAVRFTDHDLASQAVVQDINYYQQFERRSDGRTMAPKASIGANFSAWFARMMA